MSLKLNGVINQVKHVTRGENTFISVVVETDGVDTYNRPQLEEVKLSKKQISNGYAASFENYIGKRMSLPVWVNAWAGKAGASYSLFLQDCDLKESIVKA